MINDLLCIPLNAPPGKKIIMQSREQHFNTRKTCLTQEHVGVNLYSTVIHQKLNYCLLNLNPVWPSTNEWAISHAHE